MIGHWDRVTDRLRGILGADTFDDCVAHGATMTMGKAVNYSRQQIRAALDELPDTE